MPKPPLPPRLDAFLAKPNASVIATVRPDGSPVTVATWYVWEGGRVLVNMDEGRKRLEHMRADPRVSLTVMDLSDWSAHVSLQGRVISIEEWPGEKVQLWQPDGGEHRCCAANLTVAKRCG